MAGIMAFLDKHAGGTGGKLVLYCFDNETYEALEVKLVNKDWAKVQEIFDGYIKPQHHCKFAEIDLDSLWIVTKQI